MSETRHTSAPWTHSATLIYAPGERGGNICELGELRKSRFVQHDKLELGSPDWDEQMANGRLIAASPNLLALLEKALPIIEAEADQRDLADGDNPADSYWTEMRELANEIAAEVAKATGENHD